MSERGKKKQLGNIPSGIKGRDGILSSREGAETATTPLIPDDVVAGVNGIRIGIRTFSGLMGAVKTEPIPVNDLLDLENSITDLLREKNSNKQGRWHNARTGKPKKNTMKLKQALPRTSLQE